MPTPSLSKGRIAAGLQCPKRLFLEHHAPGLMDAPLLPVEARLAIGTAIGALARRCFPGGVEVGHAPDGFEGAVRRTAALLADSSVPAVFEAAVAHGGVRVRCDVLVRCSDGAFEVVEVKSGTRARPHHALDLAVQLHVLDGAGIPVRAARLLHLNRGYVFAGGGHALDALFAAVDLTEQARLHAAALGPRIAALLPVLTAATAPPTPVGPHCARPVQCPFHGHCHVEPPPLHPVEELPRLDRELRARLAALGITDVRAIPDDFPLATPLQARVRDVVRRGGAFIAPAVRTALARVRRPAHFVDFETVSPPVPLHPGTRPYDQIPVQWSDHVLEADGMVHHHEFLHAADGDPRRAFAESLLATAGEAASLVTYSGFEGDVLAALAAALPDLAPSLRLLRRRIVDLLPIVREHCYHPDFHGSFSIKAVLPALVPGLGYDDLAVQDGLHAMLAYGELVAPATAPARRAALRVALLAYCRRDTEAMVELYRRLWNAP